MPLLSVEDLCVEFGPKGKAVTVVEDVSFDLKSGEVLGIVGESGSGKSVTALSVLRLISEPTGRIRNGRILLDGKDIGALSEREMRKVRGGDISMIFQEPMASLNPVFSVGAQIVESIRLHQDIDAKSAWDYAEELIRKVGISDGARRLRQYPHEMSGGMRQRVMIAMALASRPKVLIADEPTTALDVTVQAQVMELLKDLQEELSLATILISHDLGVMAEFAHRIIVMYAGRVVESGSKFDIFEEPNHPYTKGLLLSIPDVDKPKDRLFAIKGRVPQPRNFIEGCRFFDRCDEGDAALCLKGVPQKNSLSDTHHSYCVRGTSSG